VTSTLTDPSIAGKLISKLSTMRVESAVNTDRLFGRILAEATLRGCEFIKTMSLRPQSVGCVKRTNHNGQWCVSRTLQKITTSDDDSASPL
jgi:hypothetical protein